MISLRVPGPFGWVRMAGAYAGAEAGDDELVAAGGAVSISLHRWRGWWAGDLDSVGWDGAVGKGVPCACRLHPRPCRTPSVGWTWPLLDLKEVNE